MLQSSVFFILCCAQCIPSFVALQIEPSVLLPETNPFAAPIATDDDGVASLTVDNFDEFVNSKPMTVVAFVAPWCGFCKRLKSEFAKVKLDIESQYPDVMQLARVDCVAESELYDRFEISGFPTIKIFHYGIPANQYSHKDLSHRALLNYARTWAAYPDVMTGWLHAQTIEDVYEYMEYDKIKDAYTSRVPTLLTVFDAEKINSDDSRNVLYALAHASFHAEAKHTRFIVTTDQAVFDKFMQITKDCGLTEVR